MRKKLIPLKKGAELAGKLHPDGRPNPRALTQWIRRWNEKHPDAVVFKAHNVVDEVSLATALEMNTEDRTPMIGAHRAIVHAERRPRTMGRTHRIHASEGRSLA